MQELDARREARRNRLSQLFSRLFLKKNPDNGIHTEYVEVCVRDLGYAIYDLFLGLFEFNYENKKILVNVNKN